MPYIAQDIREILDEERSPPLTAGDLTYLLYRATIDWDGIDRSDFYTTLGHRVQQYITRYGNEPKYQDYAEVLGALTATAWEFERRHPEGGRRKAITVMRFANAYYGAVIAPYEDTKIEENGDVV